MVVGPATSPEPSRVSSDPRLLQAEAAFKQAVARVWFEDACRRVLRMIEDAGYVISPPDAVAR